MGDYLARWFPFPTHELDTTRLLGNCMLRGFIYQSASYAFIRRRKRENRCVKHASARLFDPRRTSLLFPRSHRVESLYRPSISRRRATCSAHLTATQRIKNFILITHIGLLRNFVIAISISTNLKIIFLNCRR